MPVDQFIVGFFALMAAMFVGTALLGQLLTALFGGKPNKRKSNETDNPDP